MNMNFVCNFARKKSHNWRAKTTTKTISKTYKATIALRRYVSGPKVIIFF